MAKNCGHDSHKECAWANSHYHPNYPNNEQYASCFRCNGIMNKGAYEGVQPNSNCSWNIEHINSNPKDNNCKNLIASHPECNRKAN